MLLPFWSVFSTPFKKRVFSNGEARIPVITGIGIVSPIGIGKNAFWKSLVEEVSGVDRIRSFNPEGFPCQIAAEVKDFNPKGYLNRKQAAYYSRSTQFACVAHDLAKEDAGIDYFDPERTDIIIGCAVNSFEYVDSQLALPVSANGASIKSFDPSGIAKLSMNIPSCAIAAKEDIRGHVFTLSTACASGLSAVGMAMERIKGNYADVVIAGGADCGVSKFFLNLFCAANFLPVTHNNTPSKALKPFDSLRTKSVLGEGACLFIIEEMRHALARGAKIYAQLTGFSQQHENVSELFSVDDSGTSWGNTIKKALQKTRAQESTPKSQKAFSEHVAQPVDYINAHGTSDTLLDKVESRALNIAFGTFSQKIPLSSIKGAIGSPFSAAGALQLASSILSLSTQVVPANYNYQEPDPECPLNIIATPRKLPKINTVLVNGRGYGGVNASVVASAVKI